MDSESLLNELWCLIAPDPYELDTKIRSCLKGHCSEYFLNSISTLIGQEQHETAKTRLSAFLEEHPKADDIKRRIELVLIFKRSRAPRDPSPRDRQRSKESLLQEVNTLVASNKLQAAESLLIETNELEQEPDYLNLLGRVYMLQRRPLEAAKSLQQALTLKRQQQAFGEAPQLDEHDDLPTDSDLAFLDASATSLAPIPDLKEQIYDRHPPLDQEGQRAKHTEPASAETKASPQEASEANQLDPSANDPRTQSLDIESEPGKPDQARPTLRLRLAGKPEVNRPGFRGGCLV